jgi:hypothetical protein
VIGTTNLVQVLIHSMFNMARALSKTIAANANGNVEAINRERWIKGQRSKDVNWRIIQGCVKLYSRSWCQFTIHSLGNMQHEPGQGVLGDSRTLARVLSSNVYV